jgi:hypothetical protein
MSSFSQVRRLRFNMAKLRFDEYRKLLEPTVSIGDRSARWRTRCNPAAGKGCGERDIGVGAEAVEVSPARARSAIAEQPGFGAVRLNPQRKSASIREKLGTEH